MDPQKQNAEMAVMGQPQQQQMQQMQPNQQQPQMMMPAQMMAQQQPQAQMANMSPQEQQYYYQQQQMMLQAQAQQQNQGQPQQAMMMNQANPPQNPQMDTQDPFAAANPYPLAPNAQVQAEVAKQKKEEKKAAQNAPLNFIGALREDPERQRFVIKVYVIVFCQLAFTSLVTGYVVSNEAAKDWIRDHIWLYYVALILGVVFMCTIVCCQRHARIVPRNYIILSIFTICWTYMVAGFTQFFDPEDILVAACLTTAMVLGLTVFACCCNMKLTCLWGIGAALSMAVWPLFIFMWIFPSKLLFIVLAFVVVILTSIYIIWDTKMIMTKLTVDEYIIGALMLYVDIIQLFMWLLSLVGSS